MTNSLKTLTLFALFGGLLACGGDTAENTVTTAPAQEHTPAATDNAAAEEGQAHADEHDAACTCSQGKAGETTWCEACGVGYHVSEKLACQGCYEAAQNGTVHAHDEEAPAEEATEGEG